MNNNDQFATAEEEGRKRKDGTREGKQRAKRQEAGERSTIARYMGFFLGGGESVSTRGQVFF